MQELTPDGRRRIDEISHRHGVGAEAAIALLRALIAGGGTMAQFNHPDLGGMGQWSDGGMIMVGDMFNDALKAKINGLCADLTVLLANDSAGQRDVERQHSAGGGPDRHVGGSLGDPTLFDSAGRASAREWWGVELGSASSAGSQDETRYAYFPDARRLAIEAGGTVTFYDTGDHQISGVSQQQSTGATMAFTSQHGVVRIGDLSIVPTNEPKRTPELRPSSAAATRTEAPQAEESTTRSPKHEPTPSASDSALGSREFVLKPGQEQSQDIVALIERLAGLREKNILSEEEFLSKKTELLGRL